MTRLLCRLLGHNWVPARSIGPVLRHEVGVVHGWHRCLGEDSRGVGCLRCGRYDEHDWVAVERARIGRQP